MSSLSPARPSPVPSIAPDVTIVIPSWNGASRIGRLLASLAGQTFPLDRLEVVVVDDGSADDTTAAVTAFVVAHEAPWVRCRRQDHGGVNAARNAGLAAARGRYVMLLDDDEEAPADFVRRVVGLLDGAQDMPGAGGPCRLTGERRFRTCASCSIGDVRLAIDGAGPSRRLLGGNMTVRRELFDEVGPFDAELSGRGDEVEWFDRADRSFWYDDSLFVWHRRDHLSLPQLLGTGFRQGRSVPVHAEKSGMSWDPSPVRMARYLGHAMRSRCVNGLLQASREAGSTVEWTKRAWRHRAAGRR